MRPRPWLLLCVSLHGVAASVYGFPSWKHGLDYCIAEADTHHRHDSVDHHGTSNHMWDAYAALHSAAYISVNTNVAGMCEHNPIHELDYCIAEASTHHRHDSVDRHGTSTNMWDADAAWHSAVVIADVLIVQLLGVLIMDPHNAHLAISRFMPHASSPPS